MITIADYDDLWVAVDETGERYYAALLPDGTKFYQRLFQENAMSALQI